MDKYDQLRKNIQIDFEEKRQKIDLMLKDGEINDDEYFRLMEDVSYEEDICDGELAEEEYNESIYGSSRTWTN